MKIGSLFSGIGGLDLGFHWEGFQTIWFIEKEKFQQRILKKNFPNIPVHDNVKTVKFEELERPDILVGGFPCQDISQCKTDGKGIQGSRSGLWKYFFKAIRILRPKYAIIENTANIINRGIETVLRDLASAGYNAEWKIIRAKDFGAPHERRRMFIVAYPGGFRWEKGERRRCEEDVERVYHQGERQPYPDHTSYKSLIRTLQKTRIFKREPTRHSAWSTEPCLDMLAHGIPERVAKLESLGNAVVPQVAQYIAQLINEREKI